MNLVSISRVKNEVDIIEAFVRHHTHYFDRLVVVDNASSDGTYEVLVELKEAGFPIVLMQDSTVGYRQSYHMSRLLRMAVEDVSADWIVPLDADEFVEPPEGTTLSEMLRPESELLTMGWNNFVWKPDETPPERNPVVRMRLRMPRSPSQLDKVLIPAALATSDVILTQGNHALSVGGQLLPSRQLDALSLCHYPIRTVEQYASKIAVGYLQYAATPGWDQLIGFHYVEPFRLLTRNIDEFARAAEAQSRHYSLSADQPRDGFPRDAPLRYVGGPLQFASSSRPALTNILACAEAIANGAAGLALRTGDSEPGNEAVVSVEASSDSDSAGAGKSQHVFQSFWANGPLTPYESLCLKSFIAYGHGVELYSFDPNLKAPDGVRVRDAAEVLSSEAFFVYEDGFGKGSPAAFANLFRYKLIAETGGWWVDTDVLCLAADIPSFGEFFAYEDADLINNAVLHFPPKHPLMLRCLEQAQALGSSVRWGDTGPRLLTRLAGDMGLSNQALPSSICYPAHYSEAVDLLRPARNEALQERVQSSLFVHLWNQMLAHNGIQKTLLPPRGSFLRHYADRHPVAGWTGEHDGESLERSLLLRQQCDALERHRDTLKQQCNTLASENRQMSAAFQQERDASQALVRERERLEIELRNHRARLHEGAARVQEQLSQIDRQANRIGEQQAEIQNKDAQLEHQHKRIDSILESRSWRATAPLRRVSWLFRGAVSRKL